MTPEFTPIELRGGRALLQPMTLSHIDALWEAGTNEDIWRHFPTPVRSRDAMAQWVRDALHEQQEGISLPFTIVDQDTNRVVGSTRFADISRPHRAAEIGWTWLSPTVWRTRLNTECKYLLLSHGFETLDLIRVFLKTDSRNLQSQRAIERIGGVKEGVLRRHRILADGYIRDSVYYSIIAEEWPSVKHRLEGFLANDAQR